MALSANILSSDLQPDLQKAFEDILGGDVKPANFRKLVNNESVEDRDTYESAKRQIVVRANAISKALADKMAAKIVKHIKLADVTCTILPSTINVVGSPSAQVGPPALLNISGGIK